jgi:hypothetical protein
MLRNAVRRAALLVSIVSLSALAQSAPPSAPQGAPRGAPNAAQRDSLEERVRSRMAQVMRTQLGLNDEQVRRLQATNRRFETQRRELFERERRVRIELRAAIEIGDSTQDARIAPLLDQTIQLQRQRLDLQEAEQKELATFLSPLQRAKLYGFEEQMRRRIQEMRENRGRDDGNATPRRPMGGGRPGTGAPPAGTRRPPADC